MLQDVRLAFRHLLAAPAFSIVVILTLALGIGANAAIYSVVDGVLLKPAPVADLDRLVMVWETDRHTGTTREPASVPDYLDLQTRAQTVRRFSAIMASEVNAVSDGAQPQRLAALEVGHGFLPMLGIDVVAGRRFTADDDRAGAADVVLISEALWTRGYGRAPDIAGRVIRLDSTPHVIVGVVPDVSDFGVLQVLSAAAYSRGFADRGDRANVDVWRPLRPDPRALPRDTHPIFVIGRLADGASVASAQQELGAIAAALEQTYRENAGRGIFVEPLASIVFGSARPALYVLLGAVLLVLLVASVNVANLLLARAASRDREVALRAALGATRSRLLRQFLLETAVLTGLGALGGLALAYAALHSLLALAPADIPRLADITVDARVLGLTFAIAVVAAFVFGTVPTLRAMRIDLQDALAGDAGPRTSAGRDQVRIRRALVVAELALAVILVVGAGLLARTLWQLQQVDPGFRSSGVVKAEYSLPSARYPVDFRRWPDFTEIHAFNASLLRAASALPGVTAAAIAGNHPLDPGFTNSFTIAGRESEAADWPEISVRRVTSGYFTTIGLSLVRGRLIAESDTTIGAPVALINEAAAKRFFSGADPIGARITFWGAARTIVGVVANERFHGLIDAPPIAVYLPLAQAPSANGAGVLLVRTAAAPQSAAPAIRAAVRELDPELAVFGLEPLDRTLSRATGRQRFTFLLLAVFATVALLLAALGVHGVLSYAVSRRTREIGIRVALGARPDRVLGMVMREGLTLAMAGLALGVGGAALLSRFLATLLFGVTSTDPLTYFVVGVVLLAVGATATYLPARRALKIDPAVALRAE